VTDGRRLAAIMFTDVVGFTASTQADEAGTLARLQELEQVVRPLLPEHGGREVKSTGDGLLVEFDSALQAVRCAIEIQRRLRAKPPTAIAKPLLLRIGVHVGDVEERNRDVFGDAVNVAARVVAAADPGGICLSQQAADNVRHQLAAPIERIGTRSLKGIDQPMELFRVVVQEPARTGARPARGPPRLAVLPLSNISPDAADEYFADGLTEELIAVLSQIQGLRVIARTSVTQYKGTSKTVDQIGTELGVDSVLEGSVRKAGTRIRITLQLIEAATQEHLWANSYNRELNDVFAVQSEIAGETAKALSLRVLPPRVEENRTTVDPRAYETYLKALVKTRSILELPSSFPLFEEAVRLDPKLTVAYSHWAHAYALALGESVSLREGYPQARRLVAQALELDPNSSDAHLAAASVAFQCERDWAKAEAEFQRAIQLNPSNAFALGWYGILLLVLQRYDESIRMAGLAMQLDPAASDLHFFSSLAKVLSGRADEAVGEATAYFEPRGTPRDHLRLALLLLHAGRLADSRRALAKVAVVPDEADVQLRVYHAAVSALQGDPTFARRLIAAVAGNEFRGYLSGSRLAELYSATGDVDATITTLERDQREGDNTLFWEYQFATFEPLRDDPRFQSLLRAIRLPDQRASSWIRPPYARYGEPGAPVR
jgi:adenylate cyclase